MDDLSEAERVLVAAAAQDPRRRLGQFVVLRELGRGGMGCVLEAWDPRRGGGRVALKLLLDGASPVARARLEREARVLSGLHHPGIARLYELVPDGPQGPYLVLELVRGRTLDALLEQAPMTPARAAEVVAAVARAVAVAHEAGVVHRDLKPGNVMLRPDGAPVVLDFGLARGPEEALDLTRTGSIVGTLAFLAPEQIGEAKHADARADVYALGGLLFACLTGQVPFTGPVHDVLAQVRSAPAPAPSTLVRGLDPALDRLCLRCLEKEPDRRPRTAAEVAAALEAWLAGAPAPGAARTPRVVALASAVALAVVVACVALAVHAARAPGPVAATPPPTPTTTPTPPTTPTTPTTPAPTPTVDPAALAEAEGLVARAIELSRRDQATEGEALCARAIARAPGLAAAWARRGYHRFQLEDHRGAVADYEQAVRLEPGDALYRFNLAANLAALGDHHAALEPYRRAIELDPSSVMARVGLADSLLATGDLAGAEAELEAAAKAEPDHPRALGQLGYVRYRRDDFAGAAEAYAELVRRRPKDARARANLAFNLLEAGRVDDALREAEQAIALGPEQDMGWLVRGRIRAGRGELAGAEDDLTRAQQLDPRSSAARRALARVRERRQASAGAPAEARALANRAAALPATRSPDADAEALYARALELDAGLADVWGSRGYRRYRRAAHAEAAADYAEAARLEPASGKWAFNLGLNRSLAGDAAGALPILERAAELEPDRVDVHTTIAEVLAALGRRDDARARLEAFVARRPTFDASESADLGRAYFRLRAHDRAAECYTRALELAPNDPMHLANRAANLLELPGRLDDAARDAEQAVAAGPRLAHAWRTRGAVRLRAGDLVAAQDDMRQAITLAPDDRALKDDLRVIEDQLARRSRP